MNVLDVNTVNLRNVYSTALGSRVGMSGSAANQTAIPTVSQAPTNGANDSAAVDASLSIGNQASPVIGALVFIALIVGLSFLAKRIGEETEFRNIRVSPYNILIVSLAAIIGIPVWKYAFTKLPVPGVSTWVHSA